MSTTKQSGILPTYFDGKLDPGTFRRIVRVLEEKGVSDVRVDHWHDGLFGFTYSIDGDGISGCGPSLLQYDRSKAMTNCLRSMIDELSKLGRV